MFSNTASADDIFTSAHENKLIAFVLDGNHAAFSELVSRNKDRLYAAMLRIARSADLAEEIVQDTFVQAYLKLNTFGQRAAFSTWLFRIALNRHRSITRRRRFTASIEKLTEHSAWQPVDTGDSAECICLRAEARQELNNALAKLDNKSRKILVLRELDGLTYEEIGSTLKLKPGTVRSQLARSRRKLQEVLQLQTE